MFVGNLADSLAGNDGLDDVLVAREQTEFGIAHHEVVEEDDLNLVAVDERILALGVLDYESNAVGVGVTCQNDVVLHVFRRLDCDRRSRGWGSRRRGKRRSSRPARAHE